MIIKINAEKNLGIRTKARHNRFADKAITEVTENEIKKRIK
jgi:hypothetical protein